MMSITCHHGQGLNNVHINCITLSNIVQNRR